VTGPGWREAVAVVVAAAFAVIVSARTVLRVKPSSPGEEERYDRALERVRTEVPHGASVDVLVRGDPTDVRFGESAATAEDVVLWYRAQYVLAPSIVRPFPVTACDAPEPVLPGGARYLLAGDAQRSGTACGAGSKVLLRAGGLTLFEVEAR